MKLPFNRKLNPRLIIVFIILMAAFIIHSCKKDNTAKNQAVSSEVMVSLAKQWYNAKYPATTGNSKLATQSLGRGSTQDWSKTFSPYWDKANTFLIDSLTFIELPALKKGNMAMSLNPNIDPNKFNFNTSGSLTSLIIVNKSGVFYIYAMTILADSSYLKGNYNKVSNNTYRHRDADFTGVVYYNRLDGSFVNGWRYTNGAITAAISPAAPGTPASQAVQNVNKQHVDVAQETDCTTTTTTIYWEQCSYHTNDVNYEYPYGCFIYTTSSSNTICSTIDLPTNGSTGGGTSTPPPQPCTPPTDTSSNPAVDNAKYILDVSDPNPPGGTGNTGGIVDKTNQIGTTPCVTQTTQPDTVKVLLCNGLTAAERTSILNTINTFKTEDCASKFLYNYFSGKSFSFCISPGNYNVTFTPQSNSFTFSTDEAATPAFASLLEHEFFHAFQNATYPGGIATYGQNAKTGVNNAGFVNIEFEQAVFNDIATGNYGAFVNGTSDQRKAYQTWINGLTEGGTVFPKLAPGTPAYTTFLNEYNAFLNQYNALPDNPNASPVINLTPQAFINLFNSVNPNC